MPYHGYPDGIYLAARPATKAFLTHYLVLDIGNCLQLPWTDGSHPVLVHQTPPSIQAEWFQSEGVWLLAAAIDIDAAVERCKVALALPTYDVIRHNCEHFARFVVTGSWESEQLRAIGWITGLAALTIVAANYEAPRSRPLALHLAAKSPRWHTRRRRTARRIATRRAG